MLKAPRRGLSSSPKICIKKLGLAGYITEKLLDIGLFLRNGANGGFYWLFYGYFVVKYKYNTIIINCCYFVLCRKHK